MYKSHRDATEQQPTVMLMESTTASSVCHSERQSWDESPSPAIEHYTEERSGIEEMHCLQKAFWVGRSETSDEHILMTPKGRLLVRAVRRWEPEKIHEAMFLEKCCGLSWDP